MFRINEDLITINAEKAISVIAGLERCFSSVMSAEKIVKNVIENLKEEKAKLLKMGMEIIRMKK